MPSRAKKKSPKIGKRIKARRLELGLSQRKAATEHVTYAYMSRIESGDRNPSIDVLIELAEKLETTALALLMGDEHAVCPCCKR